MAREISDPFGHQKYSRYSTRVISAGGSRSVVFLVGSTAISGGTFVILQHALTLKRLGWNVTLACQMIDHGSEPWHPALDELNLVRIEDIAELSYDVAVATWWRTVLEIHRVRARHYVYFVQSVESRFYGDDPILVDRRLGGRDLQARPSGHHYCCLDSSIPLFGVWRPVVSRQKWNSKRPVCSRRSPVFSTP